MVVGDGGVGKSCFIAQFVVSDRMGLGLVGPVHSYCVLGLLLRGTFAQNGQIYFFILNRKESTSLIILHQTGGENRE